MQLRDYQTEAVGKTYDYLRKHKNKNPCIVLPTGSGKTPIIAQICKDAVGWGKRVLIVAHRKELLVQSFNHLDKDLDVGLYSAGLKSRDTEHQIIIGGIQSVYKRAEELGSFDLILIDEAHLIPHSGFGMYQRLLSTVKIVNPGVRLIGLTATPYRMDTGLLCTPDGILNDISHEESVSDLIEAGWLCPFVSKAGVGKARADVSKLHKRGGEYIESEMQDMMDTETMVSSAVYDLRIRNADRNKVLIFASGVGHGKHITEQLRKGGEEVREVYGDTLFREKEISDFKTDPTIKYMVNCDVLTIGFDYSAIDGIVLLRATCSPGLYAQICGRGGRKDSSKDYCLISDYGENIIRHGPIDKIKPVAVGVRNGEGVSPMKECPACSSVIMASHTICPDCGWEFTREPSHDTVADDTAILSGEESYDEHVVQRVNYYAHTKKKDNGDISVTMRVEYQIGFNRYEKEWICIEYSGWRRQQAVKWWNERSEVPCPDTVDEAVQLARDGALCNTKAVKIKSVSGKEFSSIVAYDLEDVLV